MLHATLTLMPCSTLTLMPCSRFPATKAHEFSFHISVLWSAW